MEKKKQSEIQNTIKGTLNSALQKGQENGLKGM